jgi:ribosomal-protein-alanine N-acetyltransferase
MKERDLDVVVGLTADSPEAPIWTWLHYVEILATGSDGPVMAAAWVAEVEGALVGFAVVRWLRGETAAELENLLVAQPYRRKGIATRLIRACTAWAAKAGAGALRLEVRASNAAALALYRRLGFVSVGVRRAYYASPVEDAQILEAPGPL